jgi:hypothetical protein
VFFPGFPAAFQGAVTKFRGQFQQLSRGQLQNSGGSSSGAAQAENRNSSKNTPRKQGFPACLKAETEFPLAQKNKSTSKKGFLAQKKIDAQQEKKRQVMGLSQCRKTWFPATAKETGRYMDKPATLKVHRQLQKQVQRQKNTEYTGYTAIKGASNCRYHSRSQGSLPLRALG